jgi:hypothetical protein
VKDLRLPVPLGINIAVANRGTARRRSIRTGHHRGICGSGACACSYRLPDAQSQLSNTADGRDFFLEGNNTKACVAALERTQARNGVHEGVFGGWRRGHR